MIVGTCAGLCMWVHGQACECGFTYIVLEMEHGAYCRPTMVFFFFF